MRVHARKNIRLKQYDYSRAGAYFVTICFDKRKNSFGEIDHGQMKLSLIGEIASRCWREITGHFSNVLLDEYIIMPNHVHGILFLHGSGAVDTGADNMASRDIRDIVGAQYIEPLQQKIGRIHNQSQYDHHLSNSQHNSQSFPKQHSYQHIIPQSLGSIIRSYKSAVTRLCRINTLTFYVWQRNYYERVIRNEQELHDLRLYITNNPLKWELDRENYTSCNFNISYDAYFKGVFVS